MIWLFVLAAWAALSAAFVAGWACSYVRHSRRLPVDWQQEAWDLYDRSAR